MQQADFNQTDQASGVSRPALIDTHAHLTDLAFNEDRAEVLERAGEAGIMAIINPGSTLRASREALSYARKTANVFAAVGLHPHEIPGQGLPDKKIKPGNNGVSSATDLNQKSLGLAQKKVQKPNTFKAALAKLEELVTDPAVVGIGEFGLDLSVDQSSFEVQEKALVAQIELANRYSLPIILHCRAVYDELEKILSKHPPKVPGIVHCFTGTPKQLKKLLNLGLYIAYGGIVTFKNNTEQLHEAVQQTPLDRMLLETDAPYLSPEPARGKRNEPARVETICQFIADLRQISYSEIAQKTTSNAREVFALPDKLEEQN